MVKQPYRVLQVVAIMNRGGTETMLMNHYRTLNRDLVQFDFLVHFNCEGDYDHEIKDLGGRIFHAPSIRPWSYISYFRWLSSFFSKHGDEYIAVHSHIQENSGFALHFARKAGIAHRLMSSHIATKTIDYKYPFRLFANFFAHNSVTDRLACGVEAGRHLYKRKSFKIIHNAIDSKSFIFNETIRNHIRERLSVDNDEILIGHVGRFNPQKNHKSLIHIIAKLIKHNPKVKAALIGEGKLMGATKRLADDLGILNNILFLGNRSDVNILLQGFDLFLMPSLYEGLPVSVIEAQAAGLPCILSDTIDKDCAITDNVTFISLSQPLEVWCYKINQALKNYRHDTQAEIIRAGYDVHENIKLLLDLYGIPIREFKS